ncbi:hypothetical protein ECH_0240 [Ehrlichia chaffeensis str. Arkansas]|uniref:Uncharacterized protein n=1 Tax=Ehrlichia chaffeensis (strain ATCC CRL-10679 / Arkansas) TaxID=205920 RepID=Q2GHM2_EHRCR|nr:hypothetical protein [Ehrlichia chaffeensis]ABD45396.1 hypothetical protein ECH_0240 [Ehrlichia chaffeensis str. Arkansas]
MLNNFNASILHVGRNVSNHSVFDGIFDHSDDFTGNDTLIPKGFNNIGTGRDDLLAAGVIAFYVLVVVVVGGLIYWIGNRDLMRQNGYTKCTSKASIMLENTDSSDSHVEEKISLLIVSDDINPQESKEESECIPKVLDQQHVASIQSKECSLHYSHVV